MHFRCDGHGDVPAEALPLGFQRTSVIEKTSTKIRQELPETCHGENPIIRHDGWMENDALIAVADKRRDAMEQFIAVWAKTVKLRRKNEPYHAFCKATGLAYATLKGWLDKKGQPGFLKDEHYLKIIESIPGITMGMLKGEVDLPDARMLIAWDEFLKAGPNDPLRLSFEAGFRLALQRRGIADEYTPESHLALPNPSKPNQKD